MKLQCYRSSACMLGNCIDKDICLLQTFKIQEKKNTPVHKNFSCTV